MFKLVSNLATRRRTPTDLAIEKALIATVKADAPLYEHLPVPVRYRACGSIDAWANARNVAGPDGRQFEADLRNTQIPPLALFNSIADFAQAHSTLDVTTRDAAIVATASSNSTLIQAFWARGGALYEPTAALRSLLDASDIADNLPLNLLKPPFPAICIIPERSRWDGQGGIEAIQIFHHAARPDPHNPGEALTILAWSHWNQPTPTFGFEHVTFVLEPADNRAISQALDELFAKSSTQPALSALEQRWRNTLNYAVKVLLYLSMDNCELRHDPALTRAQSMPVEGRLTRKQKVEHQDLVKRLYDRYVLGPDVIAPELQSACSADSRGHTGRTVATHWRRGHFRSQTHGPQGSLRKIIFVLPTIIHPERLA